MDTFATQQWHCPSGEGRFRHMSGIPRQWCAPPTPDDSHKRRKSTEHDCSQNQPMNALQKWEGAATRYPGATGADDLNS